MTACDGGKCQACMSVAPLDRPCSPKKVAGDYHDSWGSREVSINQMGGLITVSSADWESYTGTIDGDRVKLFGRIGLAAEGKIEWDNGSVWTRTDVGSIARDNALREVSDQAWILPVTCPKGWCEEELTLAPPRSTRCFVALLHGDKVEFFVYACILGSRLREYSAGPDRVLMCGPGLICSDQTVRNTLRNSGWDYLMPVMLINFPHLDKSRMKRHASVFTKLHLLGLPYAHTLFLDLDLLPRRGTDLSNLFAVAAPAGKYHCQRYVGPLPAHGELIPEELLDTEFWSPNAGVLRLDPLLTRTERERQLVQIVNELDEWNWPTFLPEQYFLAKRFTAWRNIGMNWNWEVCCEWDVPTTSWTIEEAAKDSRAQGWPKFYPEFNGACADLAISVWRDVLVWHFSGTEDTKPWLFLDFADAEEVHAYAANFWFAARDPNGVLATAVAEWRRALDELLQRTQGPDALRAAVATLAARAGKCRRGNYEGLNYPCDSCGEERCNLKSIPEQLVAMFGVPIQQWACAECIVRRLQKVALNTSGDADRSRAA